MKKADLKFKDSIRKGYSFVYIQAYTQTLSERIESIGEPKFVNAEED